MRTRALAMASLTSSNDLTARSSHLKLCFSLNSFAIGLVISAKLGTNFLRRFIWPKKDLMPLQFTGRHNFYIAFTLSRLILIPFFETMCPNNFPSVTQKIEFLGFNEILCSLHLCSTSLKSFRCFFHLLEKMVMSSR